MLSITKDVKTLGSSSQIIIIFNYHANKTRNLIWMPADFPNLFNILYSRRIKPTLLINLLYLYVDLNK